MRSISVFIQLLLSFFLPFIAMADSSDPDTGRVSVLRAALDLSNPQRVLYVALKPGYEDLTTVAALRSGTGADVTAAFLTNGEASPSDADPSLPPTLAAKRRSEAARALESVGADPYFLCFPDLASASDSLKIRASWPSDSVRTSIRNLIRDIEPHLVILGSDRRYGTESPFSKILTDDLLAVLRSEGDSLRRLFVPSGSGRGLTIAGDSVHLVLAVSPSEIAKRISREYDSYSQQQQSWRADEPLNYSLLFPHGHLTPKTFFPDVELPRSRQLDPVRSLASGILSSILNSNGQPDSLSRALLLQRLAALQDSISVALVLNWNSRGAIKRDLLQWKENTDRLRRALLNIGVSYFLSDSILTPRQLIYFRIDSLHGFDPTANIEFYFPGVDRGWVVNEQSVRTLVARQGSEYRILSPEEIEFTLPRDEFGLGRPFDGERIPIFIRQKSGDPAKTIDVPIVLNVDIAPRFTAEVLTPIVFARQGERLIVRLTNHTRDGLRDTLRINDPMVRSLPRAFRLSQKESSHTDTLILQWDQALPDGDHLFPILVGETPVARFAVRKFHVETPQASKSVGVISSQSNSPLTETLDRLGVRHQQLVPDDSGTPSQDIIIVEERAMSRISRVGSAVETWKAFVDKGGHLIVLQQDASSWNHHDIGTGVRLTDTPFLDPDMPVRFNLAHRDASTPHLLTPEDFEGWLFLKAYHDLELDPSAGWEWLIADESGRFPMVVTRERGKGRVTYVDLALSYQLANIDVGAFRLLANLIAD